MEVDNPFFDKQSEIIENSGGNLPHWHQNGKLQYVTFRLADSLPQEKIVELKQLSESFKRNNPLPWSDKVMLRYTRLVSSTQNKLLDNSYGSCILRDPPIRKIVSDAIKFGDGQKYDLLAFVIMPNHVHMLLLLYDNIELSKVVLGIKGFSGHSINKHIGSKGQIWMREYFDRIIRNEDHLKHCISYICNNPNKLNSSDYELYVKT